MTLTRISFFDSMCHALKSCLYLIHSMLCYAMLCYVMLCYAMLFYAVLCYSMLFYAIPCNGIVNLSKSSQSHIVSKHITDI